MTHLRPIRPASHRGAGGGLRTLRYGGAAWHAYLASVGRASTRDSRLERTVADIVRAVSREGDAALIRFTVRFDGRKLFEVEDTTFSGAGVVGLWTQADSVTYFDGFAFSGN